MDYKMIQLSGDQVSEIENRLERYDDRHIKDRRTGDVNIGVMYEGELIAGACGCISAFRILYVSTVYVNERFRKKGVGRMLMKKVEEAARALGANMIRLDTFNWQGAGFYLKLGYEQVGYYSSCMDEFEEYFFLKRL